MGSLPTGRSVGEVWLSGESVCRGYWRLPEASEAAFGARLSGATPPTERYLRTGDLGLIWNSHLYIVGRLKDVLTLRGRTLHASDIEAAVEASVAVLRPGCVAAVGIDDVTTGEEQLHLLGEVAVLRGWNPPPADRTGLRSSDV